MVETPITLRDIRRACSNRPLREAELTNWFVETKEGRDPRSSLRDQIRTGLEDLEPGEVTHFLIAGHSGCGKSTELVKLQSELEGFVCVSFSVLDEMQPTQIYAEDLLLVMMERLLDAAKGQPWEPNDSQMKSLYEYFAEVTTKTGEKQESDLKIAAEAGVGISFFQKLLKLSAELKAEVRLNAYSDTTSVFKLRKRPSELIQSVNAIIRSIESRITPEKRLLLIVEDLDKIDLRIARQVFIENTSILVGIDCSVLYTIPVFTFYSPDAGVLTRQFRRCSFPMIKVFEPSPGGALDKAPGHDIVKQIVHQRVPSSAIDEHALDFVISRTGGVLRMVFDVIRVAATTTGAPIPLGPDQLQYGLQTIRKEFFQQITLPQPPPSGVDSVEALYTRLVEYAKRQNEGEKLRIVSDPINEILLQCAALVEYNGESWIGVHPLVIENLTELGRLN